MTELLLKRWAGEVVIINFALLLSNNQSDYQTTAVTEGKFTTMQCTY